MLTRSVILYDGPMQRLGACRWACRSCHKSTVYIPNPRVAEVAITFVPQLEHTPVTTICTFVQGLQVSTSAGLSDPRQYVRSADGGRRLTRSAGFFELYCIGVKPSELLPSLIMKNI